MKRKEEIKNLNRGRSIGKDGYLQYGYNRVIHHAINLGVCKKMRKRRFRNENTKD